MKTVKIINLNHPSLMINAQVCDTFKQKLFGLMFKRKIDPKFGLLFKETSETRLNTAIHMFFMNFDITVLWLNNEIVVVDKALAKKWHPFYMPKTPAKYTLELHVDRFNDFNIGDQLKVVHED